MRFYIGGPKIMGLRTGVSFTANDLRKLEKTNSAAQKPDIGTFVYVVEGDHGLVKLGISADPNARLATLRTSSPFPLKFAWVAAVQKDAFTVEQTAHQILSKYRHSGEWFSVPTETAVAAITTAAFRTKDAVVEIPLHRIDEVRMIAMQRNQSEERGIPLWVRIFTYSSVAILMFTIFLIALGLAKVK